jgi:rhodanese-related sulfurtransferase
MMGMNYLRNVAISMLLYSALAVFTTAAAVDVKLTAELDSIQVRHNGKMVTVERVQEPDNVLPPFWAKTSRKCPPFCIQPMSPVPGVQTAGEYEVINFMKDQVNAGTGVIIDARLPSWFQKGTIPGSVNIPFTVFEELPTSEVLAKALTSLGAKRRENMGGLVRTLEKSMASMGLFGTDEKTGYWDFTEAKDILLWCNGPWCGQSPSAIRGLVELGYPVSKIHYYRGGMQNWQIMGLTTILP